MAALKVDLSDSEMVAGMVASMVEKMVGEKVLLKVDRMVVMWELGVVVVMEYLWVDEMAVKAVRKLVADLVYSSVELKVVELVYTADDKRGSSMDTYSVEMTGS